MIMKFQFVLRHPGCLRMFDSTLRALAAQNHEIHLLYNLGGDRVGHDLTELLIADCPNIRYENSPVPRGAMAQIINVCVASIDFLRYKNPSYRDAPKLAQRAINRLSKAGAWLPTSLNVFSKIFGWERAIRMLQWFLENLPVDKQILAYLRERPCDVMVVSPLVDFGSEQVEYLRASKALGRRTALLVHSWDNLTNKGLIRVIPDRVLLWNNAQKDEAVSMHSVPAEKIIVTGAQCYDIWYDMQPVESRVDFCRRVGLDPDRPFVLYTGSSSFIGADAEPILVEELYQEIRNCVPQGSNELQILVRPHPQNAGPWEALEDIDGIAVYPRGGALPVELAARADYFHSLYYACAVVGVNTSAMIEASIVGRPVLTVLDVRFHETQRGTLHFHHLLEGGHLLAAKDINQLATLLYQAAEGALGHEVGTQRFLNTFVRPFGAKETGTPRVVDALMNLSSQQVNNTSSTLGLQRLIAMAIASLFLPIIWLMHRFWKGKTNKKANKRKITAKVYPHKAALKNVQEASSKQISEAQLVRKPWKDVSGAADIFVTATKDHETELVKRLRKEFAGKKIIIGPWLSEVGFEILYWVPFVRWLAQINAFDPENATLVTRGGAEVWYEGLYKNKVDIYSMYSLDEFKRKNELRIQQFATQKHIGLGELDKEILSRIEQEGGQKYALLHPKEMYIYLQPFLAGKGGRAPMELARRVLLHNRLERPSLDLSLALPEHYVAVKFYFRSSFPATPENRQFVAQTLAEICANHQVVLLNTRMEFDDHVECDLQTQASIHRIDHLMTPANNLAVQTVVIAGAEAFFGTYGGLSYVPLFYGVPSFAFRSSNEGLNLIHLHLANEVAHTLNVPFHVFHSQDFSLIQNIMGVA